MSRLEENLIFSIGGMRISSFHLLKTTRAGRGIHSWHVEM